MKYRLMSFALLLFLAAAGNAAGGDGILDVVLGSAAFNPTREDTIRLKYRVLQPEKATVRVYDPDGGLVRIIDDPSYTTGIHKIEWDGRDDQGEMVPDEAYTFTVETVSGSIYDPTTFSGGIVGHTREARFDRDGTVVYKLPAPARVLIRLGVQSGPMLKTLVDWKPRVAGVITEYWDGRDEDKVTSLRTQKGFTALITYVSLPDATVIAYGNAKETYRDYKLGRGKDRPRKPERPRRAGTDLQLRPEHLVPPAWSRAPRVLMSIPRGTGGMLENTPNVSGIVDVLVSVDPSDRSAVLSDQFEVIFFVDNVFFAEAERGYLPFNWRWELNQIPPGEHVLTVNIISFKGQVGVASRKVNVVTGP